MTNRDDYCRSTITNFSGNRIVAVILNEEGSSTNNKKIVNPLDIYSKQPPIKNILPTITVFCDLDADIKYSNAYSHISTS